VLGYCTADIVRAGSKLRWIQSAHAGIEKELSPELAASKIVFTNTQRVSSPQTADQAFALLLSLTRGLKQVPSIENQDVLWGQSGDQRQELHGKTMLVIGLGGLGTQISRRAHGFGMRVMALDSKDMPRPDFVFSLDKPAKLMQVLPKADVVVLACPLTAQTRGMVGEDQLKTMKNTAYLINVARGSIVQTPALVEALDQKRIAGAGLDVADPEPLPPGHPLWRHSSVIISPHVGGQSAGGMERQWRLWRENVRRYVAGEPLLCVVDKEKGY
jgi:phosphoglycerate dehydrogenase-like enzyme